MNSKIAAAKLSFVQEIYRSTRDEIFKMHRNRRDFLNKIQHQLDDGQTHPQTEMLLEPSAQKHFSLSSRDHDISNHIDSPCDSESLDQLDHLAELLQRKLHLNVISTSSDTSFGLSDLNTFGRSNKTTRQPNLRHSNFWNRYLQKLPVSSCSKDFRPSDWLMCVKPKGVRCVYTVFPGKSILIEVEGKCTQFRFNPLEKFLNQSVSNPKSIFDCLVETKGNKRIVYILDMIMLDGNPLFEIPAEVRDFFLTGRLAQKMNVGNVESRESTSYSLNDHPQLEIRVLRKFECTHQNALRLNSAANKGDGLILMEQSEGYSLNTVSHNFIWIPSESPRAQILQEYNPPRIMLDAPLLYSSQTDTFMTLTPPEVIHYPFPQTPSHRPLQQEGLHMKPSHQASSPVSQYNYTNTNPASPTLQSPASPPTSPNHSSSFSPSPIWPSQTPNPSLADMQTEPWTSSPSEDTCSCTLESASTRGPDSSALTTLAYNINSTPAATFGSNLKPQTPNTPVTYNVSTPKSPQQTQKRANPHQMTTEATITDEKDQRTQEQSEHEWENTTNRREQEEHVEAGSVHAVCWERKGAGQDGVVFKDGCVYLSQVVVVIGKGSVSEESGSDFGGVHSQKEQNQDMKVEENQDAYCWFRLGRQITVIGEYNGQALTWQELVEKIRTITHPLYYDSLLEMLKV